MPFQYSEYEYKSRKKISNRTNWVIQAACLLFGVFNINLSSWNSVVIILLAAGMCVVALVANHRNHVTTANILLCVSCLIAITYSIYDGDGLLDPGIIGYPLFILVGTLLLSKRFTPWLTLAAILCLVFIGIQQQQGMLNLTIHLNDASNLAPIIIFLLAGALVVWVILDNMENNFNQLRESELELRRSYELTIQGLSKALDVRDVDTGGHSHRVVEMTVTLARSLGLGEKEIANIKNGAYLHDIGKIGIPDAILYKQGPLSPAEWEVMRKHTLLADEVLSGIPYLAPSLAIPKYHHERWDGSGYPDQLKGADIPFGARIFAVVDVWDALTNNRPYRKAWSNMQTMKYLQEESGKLFDPQVVSEFLYLLTGSEKP